MRRLFTFISVLGICTSSLLSCSSPTGVAEKALRLVGRGTFVPTAIDRYLGDDVMATIGLFTEYGDIFDNALIHNDEAEFFLQHGYYEKTPQKAFFDFSNIMFSNYQLIKQQEISYDIRNIMDFSQMDGLTEDANQRLKQAYKTLYDEYKENGPFSTWLEGKDIPAYLLRYNLENKYIANITVLKLPDDGYRVCSFTIE